MHDPISRHIQRITKLTDNCSKSNRLSDWTPLAFIEGLSWGLSKVWILCWALFFYRTMWVWIFCWAFLSYQTMVEGSTIILYKLQRPWSIVLTIFIQCMINLIMMGESNPFTYMPIFSGRAIVKLLLSTTFIKKIPYYFVWLDIQRSLVGVKPYKKKTFQEKRN